MPTLAAIFLASVGHAQGIDPEAGFEIQQVLDEGSALVVSQGVQFVCNFDLLEGDNGAAIYVLSTCLNIVVDSVPAAMPAANDAAQALNLIENMPPPAFQAALLSVFNEMGCVMDFSDMQAMEDAIIHQTGTALGFTDAVVADVYDALDDRIGDEIEAMESRFVIDEDAQTATLTDGCEQ